MPKSDGGQSAHRLRLAAAKLDKLLPQLQCGKCGYPGCLPYAQALARGDAEPNLCQPGGPATATDLAAALNLDGSTGAHLPASLSVQVARIDEKECVGCYKCIEVCPVDAIIGAHGLLHVVQAEHCTGCGLCLEACPVDCIALEDAARQKGDGQLVQGGVTREPQAAVAAERLRQRYLAKQQRPSLRAAVGVVDEAPQELARQAMNRARRRNKS